MHRPTQRRDALRERVFAGRLRRDAQRRRAAAARKGGRRMVALFAGLAMVAGVLTVTQLASSAFEDNNAGLGAGECETVAPPEEEVEEGGEAEEGAGEDAEAAEGAEEAEGTEEAEGSEDAEAAEEADPDANGDGVVDTATELEAVEVKHANGETVTHYRKPGWRNWWWRGGRGGRGGDDDETPPPGDETPPPSDDCDGDGDGGDGDGSDGDGSDGGDGDGDGSGGDGDGSGGDGDGSDGDGSDGDGDGDGDGGGDDEGLPPPLIESGDDSDLPIHDGFQSAEARCIVTQQGEQSALENNPALLITEFPTEVAAGEPFQYTVSTQNLVRGQFPPAALGGYYREPAALNDEGLTVGHFHTGCRLVPNFDAAPEPNQAADFFVAVEDGGGGAEPDFVTIDVPGLEAGLYQCMGWVGSGNHSSPPMSFAQTFIAVDTFRLTVTE